MNADQSEDVSGTFVCPKQDVRDVNGHKSNKISSETTNNE